MALDLPSVVAGVFGGLLSGIASRFWQYKRDAWLKRVEKVCSSVDAAADAGCEYWLKKPPVIGSPDFDKDMAALASLEARILAHQDGIDTIFAAVSSRLSDADREKADSLLNDFSYQATGGTFQQTGRQNDYARATAVRMIASTVNSHLWLSCDRAHGAYGSLLYFFRSTGKFVVLALMRIKQGWNSFAEPF